MTGTIAFGGAATGLGAPSAPGGESAKGAAVANPRLFTFLGGKHGAWSVAEAKAVVGDPLPSVERLDIVNGAVSSLPDGVRWILRGVTSNERYTTRVEKEQLVKKQAALGRPEAARAALIPIRKSAKWWALPQDERRALFEDRSVISRSG